MSDPLIEEHERRPSPGHTLPEGSELKGNFFSRREPTDASSEARSGKAFMPGGGAGNVLPPMQAFLSLCRRVFGYAFFFSMFVNILQLTFPLYMLQVYDKVLTSYNLSTLWVITGAATICLVVLALLEWIRSRLLVNAGVAFDRMLSGPVLAVNLRNAAQPSQGSAGPAQGTVRDVQLLRGFLGGRAVFAFFDFPWMPLYFAVIFLLHPLLGSIALLGGLVVLGLGLLAERLTRKHLDYATERNGLALSFLGNAMRNAHAARAMGMGERILKRWSLMNDTVLEHQTRASNSAGMLHALVRSLRVGLQVLIYAAGAYLTVTHASTAGVMIVAAIVMGRALAPIDQAMATYKQSLDALGAFKRLKKTLAAPSAPPAMELPAPAGEIAAENVSFTMQGRDLIKQITFSLPAGQSLALIGPSAAGKSTLCRLLLNIWSPTEGTVRLDRADISAWPPEKLGPFVGYLPQDVELFSGTVAENIARLNPIEPEKVVAAARQAGAHAMILALSKGYDTPIGEYGTALSGGQRQRLGLARALYGAPRLVVLDEPGSNLDEDGARALTEAIRQLKATRATLILVTHNPAMLEAVDNIIYLRDGKILLAGDTRKVLEALGAPPGEAGGQSPRQ